MPAPLVRSMLAFEEKVPELVRRQIAFRMMIVLERILRQSIPHDHPFWMVVVFAMALETCQD
jgi:hypothetical protein